MAEQKPVSELNYEQAFAELQQVVAELEGEQHALAESIGLFERGQALAKRCAELLDQAELKVQQLSADGELEDFVG